MRFEKQVPQEELGTFALLSNTEASPSAVSDDLGLQRLLLRPTKTSRQNPSHKP